MATLIQDAKRNKAYISQVASAIITDTHKMRASKLEILWSSNLIFCEVIGKKGSKKSYYKEMGRKKFNALLRELKQNSYQLESSERRDKAVCFKLKK